MSTDSESTSPDVDIDEEDITYSWLQHNFVQMIIPRTHTLVFDDEETGSGTSGHSSLTTSRFMKPSGSVSDGEIDEYPEDMSVSRSSQKHERSPPQVTQSVNRPIRRKTKANTWHGLSDKDRKPSHSSRRAGKVKENLIVGPPSILDSRALGKRGSVTMNTGMRGSGGDDVKRGGLLDTPEVEILGISSSTPPHLVGVRRLLAAAKLLEPQASWERTWEWVSAHREHFRAAPSEFVQGSSTGCEQGVPVVRWKGNQHDEPSPEFTEQEGLMQPAPKALPATINSADTQMMGRYYLGNTGD